MSTHWFHGESVKEIKEYLNSARRPWLGVEFRADGGPLIKVANQDGVMLGPPINDSHTCPPFLDCPPE